MHAIFVSKEMLDRDPEFEESLLEKAQKQQDLVVMSYDSENNAALGVFIGKGLSGFDGGFAVAVLNDNVASIFTEIFFHARHFC
jgi:hypothetical protein